LNCEFSSYDAVGNRISMTSPDGKTTTYSYDLANRLSGLASDAGNFDFAYDLAGRRTGLAFPNGVTTLYSYDVSGQLANLSTTGAMEKGSCLT
jgi:YD repeat-containing protein